MTYNVRDRKGRFTKIRHSERDQVTGRFVARTVDRHSLRDDVGRFRSARKHTIRDEKGRFAPFNYRHNLRDSVTGRFVSASKFDRLPWDFDDDYNDDWHCDRDDDCDCNDEYEFDESFPDDDGVDDTDYGTCQCDTPEPDEDYDGTKFCDICLGDLRETPVTQEDVIVVIVIG